MKKKLTIVICIMLLIILTILGVVSSYEPFHFTKKIFFGRQSSNTIHDEEYEDIDTIYIDVDQAIINIKNSEPDDEKIKVEVLSERKNIEIKDYNKKITIKVKYYDGCLFCKMNVINITAPESFKEYITVVNKYGPVNIESFENATMAITNRFGNVKVDQAKVVKVVSRRSGIEIGKTANASIYSLWGTLKVDEVDNFFSKSTLLNIDINKLNQFISVKNDIGDINIKTADIERDSEISVSLGDINIKKLNETDGKLTKKN